jgi:hypothetical protein
MPNVTLIWGPSQEQSIAVDSAMPQADARTWLDAQYLALDCQPLRASGKVLVADKLLSIADTGGQKQFADATWAQLFAQAAAGSTGRDHVSIDVAGLTVRF